MVMPWSSSNRSLFNFSVLCLRSIGAGWNPKYVQSGSPRRFSFSLGFKSAGVAPCSRKLLDETVKTFAVFPSWLHLLDGEDNCMLSVPLSTSDLHYSSWQSCEICQVLSTWAFTLLCHSFRFSLKGCFFFFFCCLVHASSARCLLSSRPGTASIRSCLLLPPGFFDTREAGV